MDCTALGTVFGQSINTLWIFGLNPWILTFMDCMDFGLETKENGKQVNNNKKSAGTLDLWIESMDSNIYGLGGLVFYRTQINIYILKV